MSDFSFTDWKWRAYISNSHHIEFCDESHRLSRWRWKKFKTKKREKRSPHVWFNGFILCYAQSCGQECRIDHSSTDAATNSNYNRRRKQRQQKTMKQKKNSRKTDHKRSWPKSITTHIARTKRRHTAQWEMTANLLLMFGRLDLFSILYSLAADAGVDSVINRGHTQMCTFRTNIL